MKPRRWSVARLRAVFVGLFVVSVTVTWYAASAVRPSTLGLRANTTTTAKMHAKVNGDNPGVRQVIEHTKQQRLVTKTTSTPAAVFFARIIGNALPPRCVNAHHECIFIYMPRSHDPTRTLINLEFILAHEFQDPLVQKHWVLNRLLNATIEQEIMALLDQYNASYSRIPFVLEEYADAHFTLFDQDDNLDHLHSNATLDAWNQNLLLSNIYDAKNLYAMSINHARNAMIELGISKGAKWVLPWDENCFLTENAWKMIASDLFPQNAVDHDDAKYYVVWMDRLKVENDVVLEPSYTPNAWEEPQIIFRRDATDRFDEAFRLSGLVNLHESLHWSRYGRRDKAALLIRLNVPGVWFDWGWSAWERQRTFENPAQDGSVGKRPKVPSTGFVIRLFSGNPIYEDKAFGFHREMARAEAVARQLESLEDQVMRDIMQFHPSNLLVYSEKKLLKAREDYQTHKRPGNSPLDPRHKDHITVLEVLKQADFAMKLLSLPESRQPLSAIKTTPLDLQVEFESMVYNLTALVFGSFISSDEKYTQTALQLLHKWFIRQPDGTLPHPAKLVRSGKLLAIRTLPLFLDNIKILQESNVDSYTSGILLHVWKWLGKYYEDLSLDKMYRPSIPSRWFRASNGLGLQYDTQMASLAAYFDRPAVFRYHADTVQTRMLADEMSSVQTLRDWVQVATIAQSAGIDVWAFQDHLLCANIAKAIPCCGAIVADCNVSAASSLDAVFEYGWDMLTLVVTKCPLMSASDQCVQVATAVAEQNQSRSIHMAKSRHFPPFLDLWQT